MMEGERDSVEEGEDRNHRNHSICSMDGDQYSIVLFRIGEPYAEIETEIMTSAESLSEIPTGGGCHSDSVHLESKNYNPVILDAHLYL